MGMVPPPQSSYCHDCPCRCHMLTVIMVFAFVWVVALLIAIVLSNKEEPSPTHTTTITVTSPPHSRRLIDFFSVEPQWDSKRIAALLGGFVLVILVSLATIWAC